MNAVRFDIGYRDEPMTLREFLAWFPDIAKVCRDRGWWLDSMEEAR